MLGLAFDGITSFSAKLIRIITALGAVTVEYVGKIYMETKGRPRYIIEERKGLDDEH